MVETGRRTRRRERTRDRTAGESPRSPIKQGPWRRLRSPYPPVALVSEDELEAIHRASLDILSEIGIDFLDATARSVLKRHGAEVTEGSERVRFDPAMVLEYVDKAPSEFTLHGGRPERDLTFGGNNVNFCCIASAPFCSDLEGGRRDGNYADFNNFCRLTQSANIVHLFGGYPVEPIDLPPETRHLDCHYSFLTLSDKVHHAYSLGRQRPSDAIDMLCIARGETRDSIAKRPGMHTIINTSSPLRVDTPMLQGLTEMSAHGQAVCVTPFTLSGAMSPVTIAGALAQQNAEALAVIAFTQMIRAGAPVIYGGFTSNVDMRSGAPAFGTPEYAKAAFVGGQLARRYGLSYRSTNANASNAPDAQAAWESMMSLWPVMLGHTNMVMHAAGWLEGGLTASFEKFVIDLELLQGMAAFLEPLEITEATLAIDAIRDVGPGGHFFGTPHTLERYETAFYEPLLSDWRNFESWEEAGSLDATTRANRLYRAMLDAYEAPKVDPAVDEELKAYIAKRRENPGIQQ